MDLRDELQASIGGRYTLKRELGGGMSRVFLATEQALFRDVVIKVLPSELMAHVSLERFKREVLLAARLQHAHIVPLLAAGDANGHPYYTMPFVEGESLRERLQRHDRLPLPAAVRMLREIASALAYAHAQGVVHRDIKPDNILLSSGAAMVADFGVAKALFASSNAEWTSVTATGLVLGTPAYMAPEQMGGASEADHRADLYAFGVLAYEVLTGAPPFVGATSQEVIAAHVVKPPPPIRGRTPGVPPDLEAVVMRCLEKSPADRPQTASEVVRLLDEVAARTGHGNGRAPRWLGTGRRRAATALAAAVVIAAAAAYVAGRRSSDVAQGVAAATRVAVLPLANIGGDTAVEYFADGMTDAVANEIAQLPGVRVAARSSAYRYKGRDVSVADIGRALRVGSVVQGSVQRAGDRVRVTAQLVGTSDGMLRWSRTFDKPTTALFELQDEIAMAIAGALNIALAAGTAPLRGAGTRNVQAYDVYLQAMARERKYTEPDIRRSLTLFRQAIALDSQFAAPWAGIAKAWINLADDWVPPREAYPRAREAVERALALDSASADAHAMLGTIFFDYEWDFQEAVRHMRKAVALDPADPDARVQYARALMRLGSTDSSLAEARRAIELDPESPDVAGQYAHLLIRSNLLDSAAFWVDRERTLDPASPFLAVDLGFLRMAQGRWADALREYETETTFVATTEAHRAMCEAHLGRTAGARKRLAALEAMRTTQYVPADRVARVYAALGDADATFRWLERGFAERGAALGDLGGFTWDPVRNDPRFTDLLTRVARTRSAPPGQLP